MLTQGLFDLDDIIASDTSFIIIFHVIRHFFGCVGNYESVLASSLFVGLRLHRDFIMVFFADCLHGIATTISHLLYRI